MLTAKTTKRLQGLSQCSTNGHRVKRVFQLMTNYADLWCEAAENISRNRGSKTPGVDGEIHATAARRMDAMRDDLRSGAYRPKPVRRVLIPKSKGGFRPLGIPTATDKLVQSVAARILEEIYEPVFSDHSHGFRKGRSCHTALDEFKHTWKGTKCIIEADIRGCFDNINHDVLICLLAKRIDDRRFLKLIRSFLEVGYLADCVYNRTYSGTPQGGTVTPSTMLQTGPASGACRKRGRTDPINYSDELVADLHAFDQCANDLRFVFQSTCSNPSCRCLWNS